MDDFKQCFLCGRNGSADRLDKHHIFGNANRNRSEKYGLTVWLCHERCHIFGEYAVHNNAKVMQYLRRYGQEKCMKEQNMTVEEFIQEFGKNYL